MRRAAQRRAAEAVNQARGCTCRPTLGFGRLGALARVEITHRGDCPAAPPQGGRTRDYVLIPREGCGR